MLEAALTAGLCSVGADVESLGVIPTPAVAYLVRKYNADAGIVISASHNPMEFNGIKIFAGTGYKLPDEVENQIEAYIDSGCAGIPLATGAGVGHVYRAQRRHQATMWITCMSPWAATCPACASASTVRTVPRRPWRSSCSPVWAQSAPSSALSLTARTSTRGVGSTHLENLEKAVVEGGFDCGIAFDGDADRCLACDEKGQEIDGDKIIALLSHEHEGQKGRLDGDTAVVTVMSNLGFIKFMEKSQGIRTEKHRRRRPLRAREHAGERLRHRRRAERPRHPAPPRHHRRRRADRRQAAEAAGQERQEA
jgi:phosphoglucosamine mutase